MSGPLFTIQDLVVARGAFRIRVKSLEIPAGRLTLLLGPNGTGKSTLLSTLARIEAPWLAAPGVRPPRGRILFHAGDGRETDLLALSEAGLVRRGIRGAGIGVVIQENGLFTARSVVENVAWPLRRRGLSRAEAEERARAALARAGRPPEDRPVSDLSGGEAKKVAVARALAQEPRALLLDEPFTGLDAESISAMIELIGGLAPETTPVLVTHQPRAVRAFADHIVLLAKTGDESGVDWTGDAAGSDGRIDRFLEEMAEEDLAR